MTEADLTRACQLEATRIGARLMRNNVGCLPDVRGVPVHFGLGIGSSDLIGWCPDAVFLAIEVKLPGRKPTREQARFIEAVRMAGGRAGVAYSVQDVARIVRGE